VVPLVRAVGLIDVVVVLDEVREPLVRLAADEAVEAVVACPSGQSFFDEPIVPTSTGMLWFFPIQTVLHPALRRTVAIDAHSRGMCEL
jgi:hypothetical protein